MKYYLSIDVSTTNAGFIIFIDDKLAHYSHLKLIVDKDTTKENKEYLKAEIFKEYLKYLSVIYPRFDAVFVEAALISSSNIFTAATLQSFNAMCRFCIVQTLNVIPVAITVSLSRKLFFPEYCTVKKIKGVETSVLSFPVEFKDRKKEFIRMKVESLEPSINWHYTAKGTIKETSYDISDAYCIMIAGLSILNINNNNN